MPCEVRDLACVSVAYGDSADGAISDTVADRVRHYGAPTSLTVSADGPGLDAIAHPIALMRDRGATTVGRKESSARRLWRA